MTTAPPAHAATPDSVKTFLADGLTVTDIATRTGWPRARVLALINGWKGWLFDHQKDIAYHPGSRPARAIAQEPTAPERPARPDPRITMIPITAIEPHPKNIRHEVGDINELADSIRAHGILQPLVVQPHPGRVDTFQIIAGHRRYAAAQVAKFKMVPAIVHPASTEGVAVELMLIENCQRRELGAMERAEALGDLLDLGYTQSDIARQTGMSVSWVSYYMVLLDLDEASREKVRRGELGSQAAISAVRKTRAKQRKKQGSTVTYEWEPDHFTDRHPLARKATRTCDAREHTMRRRLGDVACGQCWETVIRQDERAVAAAAEGSA